MLLLGTGLKDDFGLEFKIPVMADETIEVYKSFLWFFNSILLILFLVGAKKPSSRPDLLELY